MLKPIEELTGASRVWIFQAIRKLDPNEIEIVAEAVRDFLAQWAAHGSPLHAAFETPYDHFLVIAQDQTQSQATGCSIDKCTHMVQDLGQKLCVEFLDRSKLAFKLGKGDIQLFDFKKVGDLIGRGDIQSDTLYFDNNVQTLDEYRTSWKKAVQDTWMSRYLEKVGK